jgi:hypothetical protein
LSPAALSRRRRWVAPGAPLPSPIFRERAHRIVGSPPLNAWIVALQVVPTFRYARIARPEESVRSRNQVNPGKLIHLNGGIEFE